LQTHLMDVDMEKYCTHQRGPHKSIFALFLMGRHSLLKGDSM